VQYIPKSHEYIATVSGRIKLDKEAVPTPGFYTLTSPDMIHWGPLSRLMKMPVAARVDDMNDIYSYPSLIDPKSKSRNFETLDHEEALILFSHHHLNHGSGTMNRDLDYVEVKVK
jgi:hypothetical protein